MPTQIIIDCPYPVALTVIYLLNLGICNLLDMYDILITTTPGKWYLKNNALISKSCSHLPLSFQLEVHNRGYRATKARAVANATSEVTTPFFDELLSLNHPNCPEVLVFHVSF